MQANDRLWHSWVADPEPSSPWDPSNPFRCSSVKVLAETVFPEDDRYRVLFTSALDPGTSRSPAWPDAPIDISPSLLEPEHFVSLLVAAPLLRDDDRRFFSCAALRARGPTRWTPEVRRTFHCLAGAMSTLQSRELMFRELEKQLLAQRLAGVTDACHRSYVQTYLDVIRYLRIVVPRGPRGTVLIATADIDAEFVISALFGVPTGIAGLDQLFGGNGPILPEQCNMSPNTLGSSDELMRNPCLGGRLILVRGQFGAGKSLLACHLAASVARKGGIANIVSIEQGPAEYLYMLTTMGLMPNNPGYEIEFGFTDAKDLSQSRPAHGDGALLYTRAGRGQLSEGVGAVLSLAGRMAGYSLRLLVIDSLNGLAENRSLGGEDDRGEMHRAFRGLADLGVHTVIIEEETPGGRGIGDDENLADTVIRLAFVNDQHYCKRTIEIQKCRFQREQRGEHHFTIATGKGINVAPSPAAVRARIAQRRPRVPREWGHRVSLGIAGLGAVLGSCPRPGQVMFLEGSPGTMKSAFGEAFLAGGPHDTGVTLSVGEPRTGTNPLEAGRTSFVPCGFTSPGVVFQILDDILSTRSRSGSKVERLVIDDVSRFDLDSPLIASEVSFGHVLVDYLRRQDVLSLLIGRSVKPGESHSIRRAVANDADFHLQVAHRVGERAGRGIVTVHRSPEMNHRAGWYGIRREPGTLRVAKVPAFVSMDGDREETLRLTFFLFADSSHQNRYNAHLVSLLRSHPNLEVTLVPQDRICSPEGLQLDDRFSHRDVRIVQMDEFQLPGDGTSGPSLYQFPSDEVCRGERGFIRRLWERTAVDRDSPSTCRMNPADGAKEQRAGKGPRKPLSRRAVPFYCNIGFLVLRPGMAKLVENLSLMRERLFGRETRWRSAHWNELRAAAKKGDGGVISRLDWPLLAELSDEFERWRATGWPGLDLAEYGMPDGEQRRVFDLAGGPDENFNVMFLEILLWLRNRDNIKCSSRALDQWVKSEQGVEAAWLLRRLCRPGVVDPVARGKATDSRDPSASDPPFEMRQAPTGWIVSRQWFTGLSQMAATVPKAVLGGVAVRTLPGGFSVAGDWYLGVLEDSALPEGALHLINKLTTREAESDRLRRGIGLPTRRHFYSSRDSGSPEREQPLFVSPHLSLGVSRSKLRAVIEGAFCRSQFPAYSDMATGLSFALRSIIEFEPAAQRSEDAEQLVRAFIGDTMNDLGSRMRAAERVDAAVVEDSDADED
ncbi:MAG: hypothetical protein JXA57_11460 [Armatimonadetes bacterium]|nr:hypothetical protein [Armatimonadota bacterium]